jgi:hypothetical protein
MNLCALHLSERASSLSAGVCSARMAGYRAPTEGVAVGGLRVLICALTDAYLCTA